MLGPSISILEDEKVHLLYTIISPRQTTAVNPSLAIMFARLLFQYGAGNCEMECERVVAGMDTPKYGETLKFMYILCKCQPISVVLPKVYQV